MQKFMMMTGMISMLMVASANAQNVTVKDEVFGENDEIGTKTVQPTINRVYKIDNVAKKKAELEKQKEEQLKNANSSSEQSEGLKKNDTENGTPAASSGGEEVENKEFQPYLGGYKKRSLDEIEDNLKLSPQELLDKVRKKRQEAKETAAKQPLQSSKAYNKGVNDALKARRDDRREMTKEERRAVKEELKVLYKARRDERRNMTKAERRAIKEEMKAKEKARKEKQKADRKKRKKMRDMD